MRVLITGGAGFVGRWFTSRLVKDGHEVTVVDNLIQSGGGLDPASNAWFSGNPHGVKNFRFVRKDCRNFFKEDLTTWDLVIHLAAVIGGRLTIEFDPISVVEDLEIDSRFWRWVSKSKPKHVIHFSSSAAYPVKYQQRNSHKKLSENDINFEDFTGVPDLTYGWAKLSSEFISRIVAKKYGVHIATFRPFSGYGEDQSLDYPFPSIISRVLKAKKNNEALFEMWGSGDQSRDFVHISDIVSNVLEIYNKIDSFTPLNLGSGEGISFTQLAQKSLEKIDHKVKFQYDMDKPEGVYYRVADVTNMRNYGIANKVSIDEGIMSCLNFWEKNGLPK